MSVYINNTVLAVQPTTLREFKIPIQTDQQAIQGNLSRNKIGEKKGAEMEFTIMSPSDYQTLINYFTTGSGVYYYNDSSSYGSFAFSGLPLYQEDAYVPGSSLFRPLKVTLREM